MIEQVQYSSLIIFFFVFFLMKIIDVDDCSDNVMAGVGFTFIASFFIFIVSSLVRVWS